MSVDLQTCNPLTVRPQEVVTERGSRVADKMEWVAAQLWVYFAYRAWVNEQPLSARFVMTDVEYEMMFGIHRFYSRPVDNVSAVAWDVLIERFRNEVTVAWAKRLARLIADESVSTADFLTFLASPRPGGSRLPDMLGVLSAPNGVTLDLLEVGTEKTATGTHQELQDKLRILRDAVVPVLSRRLAQRGLTWGGARVRGSLFRLPESLKVMPLPMSIDKSGERMAEWICYHPSEMYTPVGGRPGGQDGLVLYHVHRCPVPRLPPGLKRRFESELRRGGFALLPGLAPVLASERSDWPREARLAFLALGVAGLAVLAVMSGLAVLGAAAEVGSASALGTAVTTTTAAASGGVAAGAGVAETAAAVTAGGLAATGVTPGFVTAVSTGFAMATPSWAFALAAVPLAPMPAW